MSVGRGGGHGGGRHGGHHHGGGFAYGPYYDEPWINVVDEDDPDWLRPQGKSRYREVTGEGLSTGTGGLLMLGLIAWLVFEADKRVPR